MVAHADAAVGDAAGNQLRLARAVQADDAAGRPFGQRRRVGRGADARRAAAWSVEQLPAVGRGAGGELHAWSALALVAARLQDAERAAVLRTLLEPFADRHAVAPWLSYLTPVRRALGELDRALGDEPRAREHFEAGVSAARAIGATAVAQAVAAELGAAPQRIRDRI